MAEAACNSGAETSTSTVDVHRQDQESCEADSAGPRRSMRLQNNEQEHSSMAWQGKKRQPPPAALSAKLPCIQQEILVSQ